jgi:hypothetical protein
MLSRAFWARIEISTTFCQPKTVHTTNQTNNQLDVQNNKSLQPNKKLNKPSYDKWDDVGGSCILNRDKQIREDITSKHPCP